MPPNLAPSSSRVAGDLYWLSQPAIGEAIAAAAAEREYTPGETTGGEELRIEFGLPPGLPARPAARVDGSLLLPARLRRW